MTATPPDKPRPPRKPRRRSPALANEEFGSYVPERNRPALYAYRFALAATLPLAGLACGPLALGCAAVAYARYRRDPTVGGGNFIAVGALLAALGFVSNAAGVWFLRRGLGW